MNAARPTVWRPLIGGFVVWFLHFMGCWVAVEIWPRQWLANALAWGLTGVALAALVVEWARLRRAARGRADGWSLRIGRGTVAIAGVAVVFVAAPSLVFLP